MSMNCGHIDVDNVNLEGLKEEIQNSKMNLILQNEPSTEIYSSIVSVTVYAITKKPKYKIIESDIQYSSMFLYIIRPDKKATNTLPWNLII